jgi:three-Cys-motif partner protein
MRTPEFYKGKEQTYVKHFFLENYLQTVAFHIGSAFPQFVYVDGFSGPWRAKDEAVADTSFFIALQQLNYVRQGLALHGKRPAMKAIFIEKKPSTFADLNKAIAERKGEIEVALFLGKFEHNISNILASVGSAFTFFFIDPTGWTGYSLEAIKPVLVHTPGEVVINFMYDHINRFINSQEPDTEASLDALFGTKDWRSLRGEKDREHAILNFYQEQVRAAGKFEFVTSTRILKPTHDRAYFHLVYATRNPRGIIEFRAVEKKAVSEQEEVRHVAKREARESRSNQSELTLEFIESPESKLNNKRQEQILIAEDRVARILQVRALDYKVLCPRILEIPLVWESDLKALLLKMRDAGRIRIDGLGSRGRSPKPGCRLSLT